MLTQLVVKNLAIVAELELNFNDGMHVMTGETGAGKSIIIDALSIALGERAPAEQVRAPATQAIVTASFDLTKLPVVRQLLKEQGLPDDECVIRRIISADGRSRAYINGQSVAVQQIKSLAPHLVQIHSQHQHHALLENEYQRRLVDEYAQHVELTTAVANLYREWSLIKEQLETLSDMQQQTDKLVLLNYQIQEFETLCLQPNELISLEQKHKQLARSQELIDTYQTVQELLSGTENESSKNNVIDLLHSAMQQITSMQKIAPTLKTCSELLQQAIIQVQESNSELEDYFSKLDLDSDQLANIEQRLSAIHTLARKLKVAPEQLQLHAEQLYSQRAALLQASEQLDKLNAQLHDCENAYQKAAQKLSQSRKQSSLQLSKEILQRIQSLEMPNARFNIQIEAIKSDAPTLHGKDLIQFEVSTNPGQALNNLKKVASGGELSRISLGISAISSQQMAIPTIILDEVDVGISGKTAAVVGQVMRELSADAQIICITHLPQVAAHGHHHFKVEKIQTKQETYTKITPLDAANRVIELARLMGGKEISPEAMAHAKHLLTEI